MLSVASDVLSLTLENGYFMIIDFNVCAFLFACLLLKHVNVYYM